MRLHFTVVKDIFGFLGERAMKKGNFLAACKNALIGFGAEGAMSILLWKSATLMEKQLNATTHDSRSTMEKWNIHEQKPEALHM